MKAPLDFKSPVETPLAGGLPAADAEKAAWALRCEKIAEQTAPLLGEEVGYNSLGVSVRFQQGPPRFQWGFNMLSTRVLKFNGDVA